MPTALITPKTAAENSADFTVAGTPATIGLYQATGGEIPFEASARITRKNPSGTYDDTNIDLSYQQPHVSVTAAGVYRVEKDVTAMALGVSKD